MDPLPPHTAQGLLPLNFQQPSLPYFTDKDQRRKGVAQFHTAWKGRG